MLPAARTIDRQAFASELMREKKSGGDVLWCGGCGEIDCFRHAAVAVSLKDGLHANMMGWSDVVGGDKESSQVFGNLRQVLDGFRVADLATQLSKREPS